MISLRKITIITLTIIFAIPVLLWFSPQRARAESVSTKEIDAGYLELGSIITSADEYINMSDAGLNVLFQLGESATLYDIGLFMDGSILPVDETDFVGAGEYSLGSKTTTPLELQGLIPEGTHQISLGGREDQSSEYVEIWNINLICDYHSPHGFYGAEPAIPGETAIIGDLVYLKFIPNNHSSDTVSVTGSIYGRELDWQKVIVPGGRDYFQANYIVEATDPSQDTKLPLENLELTDEAGNITQVATKKITLDFKIDTSVPFLNITSGSLTGSITQGSKIIFEGTSDPGAQIMLTVHSTLTTFSTIADLTGNWRIEFDTLGLGLGTHSVVLTALNSVGNKTVIDLGSFELLAAAQEEVETPVQIARAEDTGYKSDVEPRIIRVESKGASTSSSSETVEVAKEGRISSAEDTKDSTINWSAWILVLAMVVFASALATAGYYGYGWVVARQEKQARVEKIEPSAHRAATDSKVEHHQETAETHKQDEEPPQTRW